MKLSKKTIDEYKDIYKNEYGIELSDLEARVQGENLVNFFELLLKADKRSSSKIS